MKRHDEISHLRSGSPEGALDQLQAGTAGIGAVALILLNRRPVDSLLAVRKAHCIHHLLQLFFAINEAVFLIKMPYRLPQEKRRYSHDVSTCAEPGRYSHNSIEKRT